MACIDTGGIAAQLLTLMIAGEMPINPKVTRHCCAKLASSTVDVGQGSDTSHLVEVIQALDTALLFKARQRCLASLRSEALKELDEFVPRFQSQEA